MNQADLQSLAQERILDAAALLNGGRWSFAYYAAGYAVECALKSCLLARMIYTGWVFQEKAKIDECLTHDFDKLIQLSGLKAEHNANLAANPAFVGNWGVTSQWKVTEWYVHKTEAEARAYLRGHNRYSGWYAAMDYELLVDPQVEDGKSLIAQLTKDGFDVSVAFWVKTSEEGLWFLYIGSRTVGSMSLADAYRALYSALRQIPNGSIALSGIKLVEPSNPIAVNAMEIRDRYPARLATRFRGTTLGGVSIEEAYIYPRPNGPMSANEVVQTVAGLMNRTGGLAPSLITLRDGTQIQAVPVGIQMNAPGGVEIVLHDLNASTNRLVSVNDVISIM